MKPCKLWTGTKDRKGYGIMPGKRIAHRVVYEEAHGKLHPDLVVHHLCGVKACVELTHLDAVTPREHRRLHRKCQHSDAERGFYKECTICRADRHRWLYGRRRDTPLIAIVDP